MYRLWSTPENKPPSTRSENIDLFAAGDRKPTTTSTSNVALKNRSISSPTTTTTSTTTSDSKKSTEPTLTSSSVAPVVTPTRSSLFGSASGSKTIEAQAELLRLEAEIEQLEMEQERIDNEKQKLLLIDILLQKYISGVAVEKLFDMPIDALLSSISGSGTSSSGSGTKGGIHEFNSKSLFNKDLFLRFIELINYEQNYLKNNPKASKNEEKDQKNDPKNLMFLYDQLTEDVKRLDNLLYTNIMDDLKKQVTMEESRRKLDLRQDMIARLNSTSGSAAGAGVYRDYRLPSYIWSTCSQCITHYTYIHIHVNICVCIWLSAYRSSPTN